MTRVYLIDHGRCTKILGSTRPAHAENALLHAAQTTVRRCPGIYRREHGDAGPLLVDLAPGFYADGVVVKPFCDASLCFETCVIMRKDDDSRLANEFVRSFLRRCAPQRMPPKQMEFWLSQPELSS